MRLRVVGAADPSGTVGVAALDIAGPHPPGERDLEGPDRAAHEPVQTLVADRIA
jgi:hypothetical protein